MTLDVLAEQALIFTDVETTGLTPRTDRIIEIALLKVKNGEVVDTFNCLINPQINLPVETSQITGLTNEDLTDASTFSDLAPKIFEFMQGGLMVAHNAIFDYEFLEAEFGRAGRTWFVPYLCTLKLSKALYPSQFKSDLVTLANKHNISVATHHRALDDTKTLLAIYKAMIANNDPARVTRLIKENIVITKPRFNMSASSQPSLI